MGALERRGTRVNHNDNGRRRWQFSLRSLFVLTAIVALVCGWYAQYLPRYRTENEALVRIGNLLGGRVEYARGLGVAPPGLEFVNVVYLPASTVSDDQVDLLIGYLRQLPRLTSVDIRQTRLSAQGLRRMKAALPLVDFGWVASDTHRRVIGGKKSE